jgi:hypothetical protein
MVVVELAPTALLGEIHEARKRLLLLLLEWLELYRRQDSLLGQCLPFRRANAGHGVLHQIMF